MSNKRQITKAVVNNIVGFGISSVTSTAVKQSIPKTGNSVIDTAIVVTTFTTSWFVASAVHNPVRAETERQIDAIYDTLETMQDIKKNTDLKSV